MRQQAVAWTLAHERDRVAGFFSLGDLLRLGQLAPERWRISTRGARPACRSTGACACCSRRRTSGRRCRAGGARGSSPTLVPDLPLLVAETLSDQRLPAALTRSILTLATLDYLDRLRVAFEDDWLAMVAAVQRIVPPRMDDYVAAVMTSGPLVPLAKGSASDVSSRSTRRLAAALLAALAGAGLRRAHGQATDPVDRLRVAPGDGYASGPMPIRVRVDPPATPVQSVSLVADGRLVCTIERPPFECPWDAVPKVVEHAIRGVGAPQGRPAHRAHDSDKGRGVRRDAST